MLPKSLCSLKSGNAKRNGEESEPFTAHSGNRKIATRHSLVRGIYATCRGIGTQASRGARSQSEDSNTWFSGWLLKRGPMFGWVWQKVWCVRRLSALVYWEDDRCVIKKGEIKLLEVSRAMAFNEPDAP